MIRIVKANESLSVEELNGRYVLKRSPYIYFSFNNPRIVTDGFKTRIYVSRLYTDWYEPAATHYITKEIRDEDGYWATKSVACVCDTVGEVNYVLSMGRHAELEYYKALKNIEETILAMDKMTVAQ